MGVLLLLLLLVVPVAELFVIVQVSDLIGLLPTLLLLVGVSIAGAYLLKQQGMATWKRLRQTLNRGEMPTGEVTDGALILLGGALLLTPGFITDAVGFLLVLPVTRAAFKSAARRLFRRRMQRGRGAIVYQARVVRSERRERDARTTEASRPLEPAPPQEEGSANADGSRGRA